MNGGGIASFLKRGLITALGVIVGSYLLDGISYETNGTLVWVAALLGLFSAVLKPLMVIMALPFVVLTMGLGLLVINALLYMLVGSLVDGFYVDGFWAAFFGALIITLFNALFGAWINGGIRRVNVQVRGGGRSSSASGGRKRFPKAKDDVIDI